MNHAKPACLPLAFLFSLLLLSCTPHIYYFGDEYPASSSVDVFYKASEVKKPYATIGHMTKEIYDDGSDKRHMIELAKKKGADGIIFSDLTLDKEKSGTQASIKAELIRYL